MARIPRTPPKPPFYNADPGICRGCGQEFLTKGGERARNRRWCADCALGWRVASQPAVARAAVFKRDTGICHDCGEDCTSYQVVDDPCFGTYQVQINLSRALDWADRMLGTANHPRQKIYNIDLGDWHVDHAMPLHLIDRDKPDAWREWTLPNLRTRCPSCHGEKTTQEAKDRGKVRRLNGTTKKKSGRKIPQRANPWGKKPEEGGQIVTPDKPWLTENLRNPPECPDCHKYQWHCLTCDRPVEGDDSHYSPDFFDPLAIAQEQDRRARIQAAHKNPPQRKPERNKLKGRGFGK